MKHVIIALTDKEIEEIKEAKERSELKALNKIAEIFRKPGTVTDAFYYLKNHEMI